MPFAFAYRNNSYYYSIQLIICTVSDELPYIPETTPNSADAQDPLVITEASAFRPKYKYYNVIENNAQIVLLDQSPALPKQRRTSTGREPKDEVYIFNTTSDSYFA